LVHGVDGGLERTLEPAQVFYDVGGVGAKLAVDEGAQAQEWTAQADLGHDGSRIDTPQLDRLAQQGVKLTHFRSSAPMCSPTRAALLTGRYPHSVGVPELASPDARGNVPILALDQAAITLPEALRPAGYRSTLIGKWHLGFYKENWPRTHGFDEFWGSLIGTPTFWHARETYHNETPITVPGYYTDELATRAIASLRRDAAEAKPFFHYLAFNAPHYPLEAPFELVSKYRKRFPDRGLFAIYAAMVEHLDTALGLTAKAKKELRWRIVDDAATGASAPSNVVRATRAAT
jgi:arylsulfatase A-like enzyme